jgi:hypothetical protein
MQANFNTGMVHYTIRARTTNGVEDGYTEPNSPGTNYVPDYLDLTMCPKPCDHMARNKPCMPDKCKWNKHRLHGVSIQNKTCDGNPDGHVEVNLMNKLYSPV